jgi:hypothetical protein
VVAAGADQDLRAGVAVVFATDATWGFPSCRVSEGVGEAGAGEGAAACAGPASATSTANWSPLAVVGQRRGAASRGTAEERAPMHTVCSTWTEASGWGAVRKWAFRAGHAGVTEQTQVSLTEECGTRWGGIPSCSWLRLP